MASVFIASVLLLFLAFGLHNDLLSLIHIRISALDQFRAAGRFIWFFYYCLPLFLFPVLYHTLNNYFVSVKFLFVFKSVCIAFFLLNLFEANSIFKFNQEVFWQFTNFFNEDALKDDEKKQVRFARGANVQAIIPLPFYHEGSEVYSRPETGSMLPSMILSYHCNLPILSSFLSQTSTDETEEVINVLNAYKKGHPCENLMDKRDFLLLKTPFPLIADEERLYSKALPVFRDSLLEVAVLKKEKLFKKPTDTQTFFIQRNKKKEALASGIVFIGHENRKPFLTTSMDDYETVFTLDSNILKSGNYILSLHCHYKEKSYTAVSCNLILSRGGEWIQNTPLKAFSGFYEEYAVFEQKISLNGRKKYDFLLKGTAGMSYRISNFMLRPENTTVIQLNRKDSIINNFPR